MLHWWRKFLKSNDRSANSASISPIPETGNLENGQNNVQVEFDKDDQLVAHFQRNPSAVEIDRLDFSSPVLDKLRNAGVKLVVPLVSQGELIGLLNLGQRLSQQDYSSDDRILLNNLATQVAPALRVAQLVHQQQSEALQHQTMEHELKIARTIQQTLLPKTLPNYPGWELAAYYQPARAVGGDFYDFYELADGRIGIVIGDVTDKGIPAAMVMATTRATLRSLADRFMEPGIVLERANNILCGDIPQNMFITCLYIVLDPRDGTIHYANAGHNAPLRHIHGSISRLWATGMPLGIIPDSQYEQLTSNIVPGESVLLYSDGLVEAHNPQKAMLGMAYLQDMLLDIHQGEEREPDHQITNLIARLEEFTGPNWEQEDDVTLVVLKRASTTQPNHSNRGAGWQKGSTSMHDEGWHELNEWNFPSTAGNERLASSMVADAVKEYIDPSRLEALKTAVAEGTLNAIEHGNKFNPQLNVRIILRLSGKHLSVSIIDQGGSQPIPEYTSPNLEKKLAGLESPRGWGLFLIRNMTDDLHTQDDGVHHTLELIFNRKGATA